MMQLFCLFYFLVAPTKKECGGTASKCEEELDLFWKANQMCGGGRYKKTNIFELPKRVG